METPLISVIVPVYKVEPYLRKCLDSIVGQTYGNLEIILVDDGSPDACGAICDEYAARDGRIRVIHKENGGVSSARNAGLSMAGGEWIGWVDSDDWIEPDTYEYMLTHAMQTGSDIAICSHNRVYSNRNVFSGWDTVELLDTEKALELLLRNGVIQNYLCDKLWRRELFDGIVFPVGRTFEDIAVMHRMFERAKQVVCLPEAKYNYIQRSGSIVDDKRLASRMNHYIAAKGRLDEIGDRWSQFLPLMEAQCVASAITIWTSYLHNPKEERQRYLPRIREIAQFAKLHYKDALKNMGLGLAGRLVVRLTPYASAWAFALAALIAAAYKAKNGRAL